MYTVKNIAKSKDEVSWRVKRDSILKCTAVLKTNKEYTDAMLVKEHSHPADVTGMSVEKCPHSMKSTASTPNDKPNQILSFAAAAVPDEVQARLPAAETIKRVLYTVSVPIINQKTQTHCVTSSLKASGARPLFNTQQHF